jgi:hypothetical protein
MFYDYFYAFLIAADINASSVIDNGGICPVLLTELSELNVSEIYMEVDVECSMHKRPLKITIFLDLMPCILIGTDHSSRVV